ncbi:malto-oligosyltrehalose synthase [Jatrophihabitans sp. YIM 134969]
MTGTSGPEVPAGPPTSTYRLQITAEDTLQRAAGLVDYLDALGVGGVYLSPILHATSGSGHGYDVVDHTRVDPERGGAEGLDAVVEASHARGLPVVIDIVPNHMGVADPTQNAAWWDLLRGGRESEHGAWFDVDWRQPKIKIPVLGDDADLGEDLTLQGEPPDRLAYYEHVYPVADGTARPGYDAREVHTRQHYELVGFRRADTEQNYRRFFAVTELAGLRVEDREVFDATHVEILRWVRDGLAQGIRIDHPDGLTDPAGYLRWLRDAAPDAWITVEKILEPGETLPAEWPVAGTTGYDALTEVGQLLVDPAATEAVDRVYRSVTGDDRSFADHVEAGKRQIATSILQAEVLRLASLVPDGLAGHDAVVAALTELVVAFPVYRSYAPNGLEHLQEAVDTVGSRAPDLMDTVHALVPLLSDPEQEIARRFQQVTGAVMAKGVEDTAYYRYARLVSANEVGGDPAVLGRTVAEFHAAQTERWWGAAQSMTTLSTHDTKRGEDVRARIAVLAEIPQEWEQTLTTLQEKAPLPDATLASLLWQTILGAPQADRERLHAYAEKAMREAAVGTGWIDQDEAFEAAVHAAVDARFDDAEVRGLIDRLAQRLDLPGWVNALAQKIVQLTMPGVPDVYQGTESWRDDLVDPDNRRPVDHAELRRRLDLLDRQGTPPPIGPDGDVKLWLVSRVLRTRREHPDWFTAYTPLLADGPAADHVVAFDRGGAITVATLHPLALSAAGGLGDSRVVLPSGEWTDRLTGRTWRDAVPLAELLATYPVAFLTR